MLGPEPTAFSDWYALHGIPLGIGRENARVIYESAVRGSLERIEAAFFILYEKWLAAGHRRDMDDAMESMARVLGRPICPDCKCELVKPGNTCSMCDRPPEYPDPDSILCIHCNLPLSRHAPDLHSNARRSCPDGYGWHDHNVFSWTPGAFT